MDEELLYNIGEAILLEAEGVKDITYDGVEAIVIITDNGKRFILTLEEKKE